MFIVSLQSDTWALSGPAALPLGFGKSLFPTTEPVKNFFIENVVSKLLPSVPAEGEGALLRAGGWIVCVWKRELPCESNRFACFVAAEFRVPCVGIFRRLSDSWVKCNSFFYHALLAVMVAVPVRHGMVVQS